MIKINSNTACSTRGRFARIVVNMSLTKPLVSQFELDEKIQKVEYEGLPVICFTCGRYRHNNNTCKEFGTAKNSENVVQPQPDVQCQKVLAQQEVGRDDVNIVESFGPWMIATRK